MNNNETGDKTPNTTAFEKISKYQGISIGIYVLGVIVIVVLMYLNVPMPPVILRSAVSLMCFSSISVRMHVFFNWEKILKREEMLTPCMRVFFLTIVVELLVGLIIWMM